MTQTVLSSLLAFILFCVVYYQMTRRRRWELQQWACIATVTSGACVHCGGLTHCEIDAFWEKYSCGACGHSLKLHRRDND